MSDSQTRQPASVENLSFNDDLNRKLKESLELNRPHGLRLLENSSIYANACFKLIIILSAGAFTLVPTFIKAFDLTEIPGKTLFIGLVCFAVSLAIGLVAYLMIYLSSFSAARSWVASTNADLTEIMIIHYKERDFRAPKELKRRFDKAENDERQRHRLARFFQILAVFFYLASVSILFFGAYQSLTALSGSVFSYQKSRIVESSRG